VTASASSAPGTTALFTSSIYPYTLELPAGVSTRNWKPATRAWDGQARIATDTPNVDATGTVDGTLLVWGLPWDGTAATFGGLASDTMARFHGCKSMSKPEPFVLGTIAGTGQLHLCAQGFRTFTATVVSDGYGLVFRLRYDPAKESVVVEHLVGWLDGLTWTAP
jgi:hypothetical protein